MLITRINISVSVEVTFELSEDDYRANEFDNFMPVKVTRGTGVTIANPITLRITPLTVEQATERNLTDGLILPVIHFISPNRAGKR